MMIEAHLLITSNRTLLGAMKMRIPLIIALLVPIVLSQGGAQACTAVYAADGTRVLAGNNEDFWNCDTKMWIVPREEGKYGGIYFGHDLVFAQGGMNEKGLFFDGFATAPCKVRKSLDKEAFQGNIIERVMAECETVDEVIDYFNRYNLAFLETAMLFFGDRHGDSVIIEGDEFVRKEGRYQVVTNFYQSHYDDPGDYPCGRYRIAARMLEVSPRISVDLIRRVMAAVHIELTSPTQYTNICDLKNKIVYLYHFHNFENPVVIDLEEELKKGASSCDIPSLFPETFAFKHFKDKRKKEQEDEKKRRRAKVADPSVFDAYVGVYEVTDAAYAGAACTVTREGDRLFAEIAGEEKMELIPEGIDRFFHVGRYGSLDFRFKRDGKGKVISITREFLGRKVTAKRIE